MTSSFSFAMLAALLSSIPLAGTRADEAAPAAGGPTFVYLIGPLRLSHARLQDVEGGRDPIALLEIQNRGGSPDRLMGATVEGAEETLVMGSEGAPGGLDIPPRTTVSLAPGGPKLVLRGWKGPVGADGRVSATLRFAHSGDLKVSLSRQTDQAAEDATPAQPGDERSVDLTR